MKSLTKSFFLTFFSLCMMCTGIITLSLQNNYASAETVVVEEINSFVNNAVSDLPDYVSIQEYEPVTSSGSSQAVEGSLIEDNIFLRYTNTSNESNKLTITFRNNGGQVNSNATSDIYQYVFYPNENDISTFYFFTVQSTNIYINGEQQTIDQSKQFNEQTTYTFESSNASNAILETYELNFADLSSSYYQNNASDDEIKHTYSITDDSGKLIEGLYSVVITLSVYTCTDGKTDGTETVFTDNQVTLKFDFIVLERSDYISNTRPIVTESGFDNTYQVTSSTSNVYGYYYYFNYSYANNQIASITYDPTKYDISITKTQNSVTTYETISYDVLTINADGSKVTDDGTFDGDDIVTVVKNSNTSVSIFFQDVGNYSIIFNAVATFEHSDNSSGIYNKYSLSALSDEIKRIMVYGFGYQANYVDYDNGSEYVEFKSYTNENGEFDGYYYESADITSQFLASNSSYSQNQNPDDNTGGSTFTINNIISYITNNHSEDVVATNQAPILFTSNATAASGNNVLSYVYSTTQVDNSYSLVSSITLNDENLYRSTYTGGNIREKGTYIIILAYTFNNYYTSSGQLAQGMYFYQVFYFQITGELPSITLTTLDTDGNSATIYGDGSQYTNQDVILTNENISYLYNRGVTVQIYAWDYLNNSYSSSYGGVLGINMLDAPGYVGGNTLTLTDSYFYTIRIYYTSDLQTATATTDINVSNSTVKEIVRREYSFTIDKYEITGVTARNVSLISGSTNYDILQKLEGISTNQDFIISWNRKTSGAETYAYYRYFQITSSDFYGSMSETEISTLLSNFLTQRGDYAYLPINYTLNLDTTATAWTRYMENTDIYSSTTPSQNVLTSVGLYVFDIYDEAGNHTYEIYIKDTTSPIFALETNNTFSLIPSSHFISDTSTLYWGDYKVLQITTTETWTLNTYISDWDNLNSSVYNYNLFKNMDDIATLGIYRAFYNLYYDGLIQYIRDVSNSDSYSAYLAIEIDDVSYQTTTLGSDSYEQVVSGQKQKYFTFNLENYTGEFTYRVLIRDASNNKYASGTDLNSDTQKHNFNQYSSNYSARQTIIVSYDSSEFQIYYDDVVLTSNNTVSGTEGSYSTLTMYLSPVNVEKAISYSFTPTITLTGSSQVIQIDTVTLEYYAYTQKSGTDENGNNYYYYYSLSEESTSSYTLYDFEQDGESTTPITGEINLDSETYITSPGKYVITRTYKVDSETYTINSNDIYSRTFVLYVDRNDVISAQTTVKNANNETSYESLVGGEIFVAMYDSGDGADIVVTYPTNSILGESNGDTTLASGTTWTTNKLPVKIYVPTYKYTQYAYKVMDSETEYHYEVVSSNYDNYYTTCGDDTCSGCENDIVIEEYLLYAEIYKDYSGTSSVPLYRTTTTFNDPDPTNADSEYGFLIFYDANGNKLTGLTEAGVYTVRIYQGYNSVGIDDTFKKYSEFSFTIEDVDPDFTAQTTGGRTLNSDTVSAYGTTIQRYHTNQNSIQILWNKPRSTDYFTAEIDQTQIAVTLYNQYGNIVYTGTISAEELFNNSVTSNDSSRYYVATLTFNQLSGLAGVSNFYSNGNYIDITMQYVNHNSAYYNTVTKRIVIDIEAPNTNITELVQNVINYTPVPNLITYEDLRMRTDLNNNSVTSNTETTYNISTTDGELRYYSYSVSSSFLDVLKSTSSTESSTIYYRLFNDKYTSSTYETTPESFTTSTFDGTISSLSSFEVGNYYEIVETDLAGNLTIYTIYITDYSSNDTAIISYQSEVDNELVTESLTQEDFNNALNLTSSTSHSARLNIYSKPGITISEVNYFGNVWTMFVVTALNENGIPSTYYFMTSPWLSGRVYQINGTTYSEVSISSILNGNLDSRFKHTITFYDQVLKSTTNIYVNTRNTSLTATMTSDQTREYISFSQPTDSELESADYAYVYLTSLKIYTPSTTSGSETIYYEATNEFGYADLWQSSQYVTVTTSGSTITFELNQSLNLSDNTRIIYEYTDNYGTTYTEIHLYHETTGYTEISSGSYLYSFYADDNNLYYITANDFRYTYNTAKYRVEQYQLEAGGFVEMTDTNAYVNFTTTSQGGTIQRITYTAKTDDTNYSYRIRLDIYDASVSDSSGYVKSIYFILNNEIPTPSTTEEIENGFYFLSNGQNVTASLLGLNGEPQVYYYSSVYLYYNTSTYFLPIKFEISLDGGYSWEEIGSATELYCNDDVDQQTFYLRVWYDLDEIAELGYVDQTGNYSYIFEFIPSEYVYTFTLSSTRTTAYYLTVQRDTGIEILQKSGQTYTATSSGTTQTYTNHYIVNISYLNRDSLFSIVTNQEQLIEVLDDVIVYEDADNVRTYIYTISNRNNITSSTTNIPTFHTQIAVTFIEPTNNFTTGFYTYNSTTGIMDYNTNLINSTSMNFVVTEDSSITQLKLEWSKYYAISQNTISIHITKNGYELDPVIYSETVNGQEYYYTYITRSGSYRISFEDASGNIQIFSYGNSDQSTTFTLLFLKDVPFTITYTNPLTNELETTEPISEAIYNGTIYLALDSAVTSYYSTRGVTLSVTRNGEEYTITPTNGQYVFTETGYYGVTFSAQYSGDNSNIRTQTYYFTILNPNEYRYAFIINKYSNYYIESIIKDDVDVTDVYIKSLNLDTINVGQENYLAELTLSYLDEKTGAGTYIITVNSNEKLYNSESTQTSWTFKVTIQVGRENLIYTSIDIGDETTDPIIVSFNAGNIYEEFGETTLQIIYYQNNEQRTEYSYSIDSTTTDVESYTLESAHEYFIQLVSPSGNLLYSAKVTKNEPFNAATIIAIVVSIIVLLVVIILVILLRKRITVK